VLEYEDSIDQRIFAIVQNKNQSANQVDSTYQKIEFKPPEMNHKHGAFGLASI
jgi:hypothetical protein